MDISFKDDVTYILLLAFPSWVPALKYKEDYIFLPSLELRLKTKSEIAPEVVLPEEGGGGRGGSRRPRQQTSVLSSIIFFFSGVVEEDLWVCSMEMRRRGREPREGKKR